MLDCSNAPYHWKKQINICVLTFGGWKEEGGNAVIEPVRARAVSGADKDPDNNEWGLGKVGTSTESLRKVK